MGAWVKTGDYAHSLIAVLALGYCSCDTNGATRNDSDSACRAHVHPHSFFQLVIKLSGTLHHGRSNATISSVPSWAEGGL